MVRCPICRRSKQFWQEMLNTRQRERHGSMLFGFGYERLSESNEGVKAGVKFGEDVLNEYELEKEVARTMVYHTGRKRGRYVHDRRGGLRLGVRHRGGGYHYSLFALTKGSASSWKRTLKNRQNFYAKVVDLLLTQQGVTGSWPQDGRRRWQRSLATALSVSLVGLGRRQEKPTQLSTSLSGGGSSGGTITVKEGTAVTDKRHV